VWLLAIGASWNLVAVAGFLFFLDESPVFLYNQKKTERADQIV
jgi:hypothetical protein